MTAEERTSEQSVVREAAIVCSPDTESTYLLGNPKSTGKKATYSTELKALGSASVLLTIANMLQFSLNSTSMLVISPRGKVEFGAVSVATTTANITGFIVFQGLATSLDTLCAQAWGSDNAMLVRLHIQRMILLLSASSVPVVVLWYNAECLFSYILPEAQTIIFAGLYMKIIIGAIPGFVVFEAMKRNLTAEGVFLPVTGILCAGACTNAFLGWLLVWHCGWGFIGAPIAVAVTWTLIPMYLLLFLKVTRKGKIWPYKTARALVGWGPMLKLALPGLVMVEAEYLAFEALIIISAQLSTASLAAQTILATLNSAFWQIPFSISIAGTTIIAQHIGAGSASSAIRSARVALILTFLCSAVNSTLFFSFRDFWPTIFSDDPDVIDLVKSTLPLVTVMQLLDGLVACCNGILRGIGRPGVGCWVNLLSYYIVALPLSLCTTFGLHWGLKGLWFGVTAALLIVTCTELTVFVAVDWEKSVEDAEWRNTRPLDHDL